jgi:hypothetical protein
MTRTIGGLLAVLALAGLVGCQAAPADPAAAPTPAATSATGPSATGPSATGPSAGSGAGSAPAGPAGPRPGGVIPDSAFAGHRPFTGPAVEVYGQAALLAAYKEMVTFAFEAGWSPVLIRKDDTRLSTSDLNGIRSYLTAARRAFLDATFARVVRSDRAAIRTLEDVAFFGITGAGGLTPVPAGNVVTGRRFTDAAVAVAPKDRLTLSFAAKANIQLQNTAGHRYELPTGRTLRYTLVRNTGPTRAARPFLVDSWTIAVSVRRPEAAPPSG